jgi:hypothetical protein
MEGYLVSVLSYIVILYLYLYEALLFMVDLGKLCYHRALLGRTSECLRWREEEDILDLINTSHVHHF